MCNVRSINSRLPGGLSDGSCTRCRTNEKYIYILKWVHGRRSRFRVVNGSRCVENILKTINAWLFCLECLRAAFTVLKTNANQFSDTDIEPFRSVNIVRGLQWRRALLYKKDGYSMFQKLVSYLIQRKHAGSSSLYTP